MIRLALMGALAAGLVQNLSVPAPDDYFVVRAVTASGEVYDAGVGPDCETAWEFAVLPKDWREVYCVQMR